MLAHDMAIQEGGTFLLRIEDIDKGRSRPEWETQIFDDLHWLGLTWPEPVMCQSTRSSAYQAALDDLWARDLLFPCCCSRRDIEAALNAPQEGSGSPIGPDGVIYPGTCRPHDEMRWSNNARPTDKVIRLNIEAAIGVSMQSTTDSSPETQRLYFDEIGPAHRGHIVTCDKDFVQNIGDIVLARQDMGTSYHLSVVLDDAAQRVTHVVRGEDLFEATRIHVLLQKLLNLPTPVYHHHRLIRDEQGKRLAKRDDARALSKYRAEGATPEDIRRIVGL